MSDTIRPIEIFCSYAREDESFMEELKTHLSGLQRQGRISVWHDRRIVAGQEWAREIDEHLDAALIILLLISPNFLASDYCYGVEMQRALQRHKNGEIQVIPILLRPVDWDGTPIVHLQCLPRDARAITEWGNQDVAFRDVARGIRTALEQLSSTSTKLQPVPTVSGASAPVRTSVAVRPTDRNRERMLKRVHATWIAGVLEQSLHGAALIVLGLEEKVDVLDNPWRLLMQEVDRPPQLLPEGTRIAEVYNATEGGLLILGEPGAGKTTLLLELTRDLLNRAQTSEDVPIPVIFNLSSWAKKRLSLSNWLVEELSLRYEVPRRLGQSWVNEDRLLLLLDGLDEVASAVRQECIEAINSYRQTRPDVQIVVCSRSTEYLNESTQLRLRTAVVVQPLTQVQIDTYLESAGEQAKALREALRQDADLHELATTPLMLTVLLLAYRGTSPDQISELTSALAKREQIFAAYVQHMLKRRGASKRYKPERVLHWLSYLARQMKRQNQTLFYIEQMQPDWLSREWRHYMYLALVGGVSGGLFGGPMGLTVGTTSYGWYFSNTSPVVDRSSSSAFGLIGLVIGLIIGLNLGLIIGLFSLKSAEIRTAEVITWSWSNARLASISAIIGGSLGWLITHHLTSFIFFFYYSSFVEELLIIILLVQIISIIITIMAPRNPGGYRFIISRQRIWHAARRGTLVGIYTVCIGFVLMGLTGRLFGGLGWYGDIRYDIFLVAIGCVSGLISGLFYGISSGQLETYKSFKPNQGIWRSLYNGGRVLLIVGFIVWVAYGLPALVNYGLIALSQLLIGAMVGISIGFLFGLFNGGIACIKHVILRIFLWRARSLPWDCVRFLDYAAERILLRKVGGGYIFVHRLLLEHFASLATPLPKDASSVSARSDSSPVLSKTAQVGLTHQEDRIPNRKAGFTKEKRIATLSVILLLLLELSCGTTGIFSISQYYAQRDKDYKATAQANNATATAIQTEANTEANTTAEALANASPVAYPPTNKPLVLDDPLQDNSKGNSWDVDDDRVVNSTVAPSSDDLLHTNQAYNGTKQASSQQPGRSSGAFCKFTNRAYNVINSYCVARTTDFTNFIYEVEMKIVTGNGGGIAFRIDPTYQYESYSFVINQDGSYSVSGISVLAHDSSSAILRGLNQPNLVAAVVREGIIELYVNHRRIAVVGSSGGSLEIRASASTHGQIGVVAANTGSSPTEVMFQNAKVWKL